MNRSATMALVLLCSIGSAAAGPAIPTEPSEADASITVKAKREKLRVLSAQMVKLEDQIYADYNRLNLHHQYDIVCAINVPTGSLLKNRQCLPAFVREAREGEALDFLQQLGGLGGHPARPAGMVILEKREDFTKNYRNVINSHPELLKLDQKYGELEKDYEAVLTGRLQDHMIDWR